MFVLVALIIYRIGTFIPVPGVNPASLLNFMNSQQGTIVDVFNLVTGGALGRFSLFALGVMPYISASIITLTCILLISFNRLFLLSLFLFSSFSLSLWMR